MPMESTEPCKRNNGLNGLLVWLAVFLPTLFVCLSVFVSTGKVFAADFTGKYMLRSSSGDLILNIKQGSQGEVTGKLTGADGTAYALQGLLEDGDIEGIVKNSTDQAEFDVSRDVDDNQYYFAITSDHESPMPGIAWEESYLLQPQPQTVLRDNQKATTASSGEYGHDARLLGLWAYQESMTGGGFSVASVLYMRFNSDGTFVQGDGRTMASGAGIGADTGYGGNVEAGHWRTQGNVLYGRIGTSPWVAIARYQVDGARLLLNYSDGSRQLWYRN